MPSIHFWHLHELFTPLNTDTDSIQVFSLLLLRASQKAGVAVEMLVLQPITVDAITPLVCDAVTISPERATPLVCFLYLYILNFC